MNIDLTAALRSLQGMGIGFLQQLPYLVLAVLVYIVSHIAARGVRRGIRHVTNRRRHHQNVGQVLGRLAEGGLMLVGVLVALVTRFPPSSRDS